MPKPPILSPGTIRVQGTALHCQITVTEYRSVNEVRRVIKQGQVVIENSTRQVPYSVVKTVVLDPKMIQAYKTGARSDDPTKSLDTVDPAALPALLKNLTQVMIAHVDKLKPEDVKDIKAGTLILILSKPQDPPKPPESK